MHENTFMSGPQRANLDRTLDLIGVSVDFGSLATITRHYEGLRRFESEKERSLALDYCIESTNLGGDACRTDYISGHGR